jgi:hypothetical protein
MRAPLSHPWGAAPLLRPPLRSAKGTTSRYRSPATSSARSRSEKSREAKILPSRIVATWKKGASIATPLSRP